MLAVANYHYIREDFSAEYQSIFGLTPKQFRTQLEALSREGHFISQDRLLEFRNREFDRNYILVTFDDGLKEQYELAKPILNHMGIPFLFFINTSNFQERSVSLVHKIHLLRSRICSKDLLKELEASASALTSEEKKWGEAHYNYDDRETAQLKYLLNFKLKLSEQREFIDPLFQKVFDEQQIAASLYFDKDMLRQLSAEDSLGSHSHHHLPLGGLDSGKLKDELERSQDFFQKEFGIRSSSSHFSMFGVTSFCTNCFTLCRKIS